ncbi:MAG: RNA polymerase sigma factor [Acidobacteriota bacterium]
MQDREAKIKETIEAFALLIRQVIQKNLHRNDALEVEDIEQEVKLKIWIFLKKGKKIHNLASYIKKVAYSTTVDELRKMRKQSPPRELDELKRVYISAELVSKEDSARKPELFLEDKENRISIRRSLESLSENRKQVLRLYLEGFSIEEIGEYFDWDKTKVRHLLYRGIADLRGKTLDEKDKSKGNPRCAS